MDICRNIDCKNVSLEYSRLVKKETGRSWKLCVKTKNIESLFLWNHHVFLSVPCIFYLFLSVLPGNYCNWVHSSLQYPLRNITTEKENRIGI